MKENNEDILTIFQFADLIHVHHNTVRSMIKNGKIAAFRLSDKKGSSYRIPKSEVSRMIRFDLKKYMKKLFEENL